MTANYEEIDLDMCENHSILSISCFCVIDFKYDIQGILSYYLKNGILCSIFPKEVTICNGKKKLVNKYCQYFQFTTKNVKKISGLDLEVI